MLETLKPGIRLFDRRLVWRASEDLKSSKDVFDHAKAIREDIRHKEACLSLLTSKLGIT